MKVLPFYLLDYEPEEDTKINSIKQNLETYEELKKEITNALASKLDGEEINLENIAKGTILTWISKGRVLKSTLKKDYS